MKLAGRPWRCSRKAWRKSPAQRCTLEALNASASELLGESLPPPATPPARFWTEEQVVRFHDRDYRIVARLGSGGIGDDASRWWRSTSQHEEDLGTYVAKVGHSVETGERVLEGL